MLSPYVCDCLAPARPCAIHHKKMPLQVSFLFFIFIIQFLYIIFIIFIVCLACSLHPITSQTNDLSYVCVACEKKDRKKNAVKTAKTINLMPSSSTSNGHTNLSLHRLSLLFTMVVSLFFPCHAQPPIHTNGWTCSLFVFVHLAAVHQKPAQVLSNAFIRVSVKEV